MPTASDDAFFAGHPQKTFSTSAGPCELPIFYTDASLLGLIYRVDPARAAPLVPTPFEPWVVLGKAMALVCAFDYRATTIGPYGEAGVAVFVKRAGSAPSLVRALIDIRKVKDVGLHVASLPVTTEGARAAGVELWGYPKYLTQMETTFGHDGVRFVLRGELELTMGRSGSLQTGGMPFVTYSVNRDGRVLRTIVDVDHRVRWGGAGSVEMKVLGDGPMVKCVKALGLDGAKPSLAMRTDAMRSILPAGEDMGGVAGAGSPAKPAREAA
jgi:hypothetical protein